MGHLAVQMAKWRGAQLFPTSSSDHLDFVRQPGADETIDYTTTAFEDVAREVDLVFDTIGGETFERSWKSVKPEGVMVKVVEMPGEGTRHRFVGTQASSSQLAELATLIDANHIKPFVSTVLPLQEAQAAHRMIQGGHTRGKIVFNIAE